MGENATGGAVFVASNDPVINGGHTGYIQADAGNYSSFGAQGAINLPAGDKFAARVAFNALKRDSFYDITGPYTGDDGVKNGSFRLGMLWEPSDSLSLNFKADYNYLDLSGYPSDPVLATNDLFDITANADFHALDRFGRAVLKVDYEFGNGTTLRSVSGYQKGQTEYRTDLDGTYDRPIPPIPRSNGSSAISRNEDMYSEEINLISSEANSLKWILGAYYQHDHSYLPAGRRVLHRRSTARLLPARRHECPEEHGVLRPVELRHAGGFPAAARSALFPPHHRQRHQHQPVRPAAHAAAGRDVHEHLGQGDAELHGERTQLPVCLCRHGLPAGRSERAGRARGAGGVRRRKSN